MLAEGVSEYCEVCRSILDVSSACGVSRVELRPATRLSFLEPVLNVKLSICSTLCVWESDTLGEIYGGWVGTQTSGLRDKGGPGTNTKKNPVRDMDVLWHQLPHTCSWFLNPVLAFQQVFIMVSSWVVQMILCLLFQQGHSSSLQGNPLFLICHLRWWTWGGFCVSAKEQRDMEWIQGPRESAVIQHPSNKVNLIASLHPAKEEVKIIPQSLSLKNLRSYLLSFWIFVTSSLIKSSGELGSLHSVLCQFGKS